MYLKDHNDLFDNMYCAEPDNLLNMLKYQYLTKIVLNLKEALYYNEAQEYETYLYQMVSSKTYAIGEAPIT